MLTGYRVACLLLFNSYDRLLAGDSPGEVYPLHFFGENRMIRRAFLQLFLALLPVGWLASKSKAQPPKANMPRINSVCISSHAYYGCGAADWCAWLIFIGPIPNMPGMGIFMGPFASALQYPILRPLNEMREATPDEIATLPAIYRRGQIQPVTALWLCDQIVKG